jgi:hypothetical protein
LHEVFLERGDAETYHREVAESSEVG